jgi:hypothetical protein
MTTPVLELGAYTGFRYAGQVAGWYNEQIAKTMPQKEAFTN